MSAFFVAINRSRSPFDAGIARGMMRQIAIFGHDVSHLVIRDHFSIGYQARWSVPEEIDEVQPLFDAQSGQWFVFIGRIDNREKLIKALSEPALKSQSDAQLMLRFCQQFGQDRLNDVIGPFVFVLFDASTNEVLAARDAMGGRYLCYSITEKFILLATYEMAIVAHDSIDYCFNQEKVARALVSELDDVPSSTIAGITPVKPGELLSVKQTNLRLKRFYQPLATELNPNHSDAEYANRFRFLLTQAVERRMRCVGSVGTMLSGGLDSVPMTIAAKNVSRKPLVGFSWVFDAYPQVDERVFSSPICNKHGIKQVAIVCDRLWPKLDESTLPNPVFPFGIPYSEWQQETFRQAQQHGVKTLLTGIHGDLLYGHAHSLLYELVRAGRVKDAAREFVRIWRAETKKWPVIKYYLIRPMPGVEPFLAWRTRRKQYSNPALKASVNKMITRRRHWLETENVKARRSQQWRTVFDGFAGEDVALGRYMEAKFSVDRRYPFRDRELCEFMTSVPADQLYFNGMIRPIVKRAFHDELGPELRTRNSKTSFDPVVDEGVAHDKVNQRWFNMPDPHWGKYVNKCYINQESPHDKALASFKWRCGYYEYWNSVCYNRTVCKLGQTNNNA